MFPRKVFCLIVIRSLAPLPRLKDLRFDKVRGTRSLLRFKKLRRYQITNKLATPGLILEFVTLSGEPFKRKNGIRFCTFDLIEIFIYREHGDS